MKLNKLSSVCSAASESSKNVISRKGSRTSLNFCYPKQPIPTLNIVSDKGSKNGLGCLKIKQKRTEKLLEIDSENLESCFINIMPSNDYKVKEDAPLTARVDKRITPKMIEIKLKDSCVDPFLERHLKCLYMPKRRQFKNKTCGTQTLYRESSMQTLPYMPDISNDKETLKTLELFKLPKLLKGDGPPGLREVEILERARKRWSLEKTMKKKFQCSMRMARSDFARKRLMKKHKAVLEAFEWENWLEREERIQACQMLRFQLVLRIFHKREQEMYKNSNKRIQLRCEQALAKRNRALKKNEIEFDRKMRRLRIEHEKRPRNWRNDKISIQLGDPSSEYYAPQMRYGVNPNRRHFELSRKAFEMRMEDLEKRAVNMKNLACPFAKLKEWSKPKAQQIEVEQNFCSDANLQQLYENLKGLREQSQKHKTVPKCLVERTQKHALQDEDEDELIIEEDLTEEENPEKVEHLESPIDGSNVEIIEVKRTYSHNSVIEMFPQSKGAKVSVSELLDERNHEELEIMLAEYSGSGIGWLIRFLSEEMRRLQEQRKLHFLSMLAQKERWRREAREAGLRQKENEMRKIYEEMFDETEKANIDVCEQYLSNIFGVDTQEQADSEAITTVTELAKVIDADIQRWLVSFNPIQNPLNYDDLRCLLRDLVFPDELADCHRRKYEADLIVDSIVKDMFDKIIKDLEPFDVCSSIANDFVDRLIDNDLYLFSSECSSSCDCGGDCDCEPPELEAAAILRKLIRQSVPGRRWRTSTERIAEENVGDIIDSVCEVSKGTHRCVIVPGITRRRQPTISKVSPQFDLQRLSSEEYLVPMNSESSILSSTTQEITVISYKKPKLMEIDINKRLTHSEELLWVDSSKKSTTEYVESIQNLSVVEVDRDSMIRSSLKPSKSAYDMLHPERGVITNTETSTEESYLNTNAMKAQARRIPKLTEAALITKDFVATILNQVLKNIEPNKPETDPSITETELETSVSYISYQSVQSEKVSSVDLSSYSQTGDQSIEEEESKIVDEPKYKMVMYEGELNKILYDDDDECKCQMEIDYKNHIKSLYENNQIQVIFKDKTVPAQADEILEPLELTFEYSTSSFEFESSFNQDATIETDEELDMEKAAHRVTFNQSPEEFKIGLEAVAEASAEKVADTIAEDSQHAAMEEVPEVSEGQETQSAATEQKVETAIEEVAQASEGQEAQPAANEQPVEAAQQEDAEPEANPPI